MGIIVYRRQTGIIVYTKKKQGAGTVAAAPFLYSRRGEVFRRCAYGGKKPAKAERGISETSRDAVEASVL